MDKAPHDEQNAANNSELAASITLNDALKLSGLAGTGGQAKQYIQQGYVKVNGVTETRRKRKVQHGDVLEYDGHSITLDLQTAL